MLTLGSKKSDIGHANGWFLETKQRMPKKERIFLVAPEDRRLHRAELAIQDVFGRKFEIVTATSLSSFEDLLDGICGRIRESCFVIVIYAKCSHLVQRKGLRLPRDNIPFELGVCYGAGVPVMFLRDSEIRRRDMEAEFSDIKGKWCETLNLQSRVQMRRRLKSEYEKLKPQVIQWLVDQYLPSDFHKIPKTKRNEVRRILEGLAEDAVEIQET